MLLRLFLAFTIIPFCELYLLIEVGSRIGALPTLGLVILTGFAGAYLARMQGAQALMRVRSSLDQGRMPTEELIDGLLILIAGIVLLTPGLITDCAGLVLLFPPTREPVKAWLKRWFTEAAKRGAVHTHVHYQGGGVEFRHFQSGGYTDPRNGRGNTGDDDAIDVEPLSPEDDERNPRG